MQPARPTTRLMSKTDNYTAPSRLRPDTHQRGREKVSRIPVKVERGDKLLRKPAWIRAKTPVGKEILRIKKLLRRGGLSSVCEEAACPNLGECFAQGTATFMILGDVCTRRCPFCDVAHGTPLPPDSEEPARLAAAVKELGLRHLVITSVTRDDLPDGGAGHYAAVVSAVKGLSPGCRTEILVPDFRGRMEAALGRLENTAVDIFNHNLETVPRLYPVVRPGADYAWSLQLLQRFRERHPHTPTKSGLMLGLGETLDEVQAVMADLRAHGCDMLTLGQYLQPSREHLPVQRFVPPAEFDQLKITGEAMGFGNVSSAPMVRSSYHADHQANHLE
jgi:lipoic acid synthetase